jgi:subtilisin family serine protease
LVEISPDQDLKSLQKALENEDGRSARKLDGNWIAVELEEKQSSEDLQESLEDQGIEVVTAEPQQTRVPTSSGISAAQWALNANTDRDINAPEAWSVTRGRDDVVVAVVDSGVDASHPDLKGAVLPGATFNGTQASATSNVTAHGTAVAGTIAARGSTSIFGAAPNVKILPVKVFGNQDGTGQFSMASYIAGIDWATANGADIINLSLGCPESQPSCYSQAEHDALARAQAAGVLVVASAGNKRRNNDVSPDFPSGYDLPSLISVAAVDRDFQLASFSQWGPASVDIAAPGVDILTTTPDNSTAPWSGTSFAAPLVAGTAALVMSAHPTLTAAQVRERIMNSSRQTSELALRVGSGGVVDAHGALLGQRLAISPSQPLGGPAPSVRSKISVLSITAPKSRPPKIRVRAKANATGRATVLVCTIRNKGRVIGSARYRLKSASKSGKVFSLAVPVRKLPSRRSKLTVTFTEKPGKKVVGRATHRLR